MSGYGIILVVGIVGTITLLYFIKKVENDISKALTGITVGDIKKDPNDIVGASVLIAGVFAFFSLLASVIFIVVGIFGIIYIGI